MFQKIRFTLHQWYQLYKRDLPWRDTTNPYYIWISEIILQQTRVAQGYDYYMRFIERFPTIAMLATAPEDEVLKLWQGLGYYSRARNLHAASKQIMELHNGVFPNSYNEVLALKGVGAYTAAAICSFAYDQPYAVLDGNVYRVLSRLFGVESPINTPTAQKEFTALAQQLLDLNDPHTHNQAVMEFGALQCVPVSPRCSDCPLHTLCAAFRQNRVGQLPVKTQKTKMRNRYFNYLFIEHRNNTYLHRRGAKDIWQGLYEFPLIEDEKLLTAEELVFHKEFRAVVGVVADIEVKNISADVKHILSHQRIFARFFHLKIADSEEPESTFIKVALPEVQNYAVARLTEIYLEQLS